MIGSIVTHKTWGEGEITAVQGWPGSKKLYLAVSFHGVTKGFTFPDAIGTHLFTESPAILDAIAALKTEEALQASPKRPEGTALKKPTEARHGRKETERENIAFKCNYCDGGRDDVHIGFNGVCSDAMIRYNIETAKRVWCSTNSPCRRYLNGEITREELEAIGSAPGDDIVCYECTMLRDWQARAGIVQNGANKGKPMRFSKVQPHSLAILTTREPGAPDDRRFIFAVFLVDDSYEGDAQDEGFVSAHGDWRIELTPDEAKQMLFWNYYRCPRKPEVVVFGSGLHRYLNNVQAAQVLRDIIRVKTDEAGRKKAEALFSYFCRINGLNADEIPAPAGALCRNTE